MIAVETHESSKYITVLFALFLLIPTIAKIDKDLIYILQWTNGSQNPWESWTFWYLETGQASFVSRNCSYQNCYISPNRSYFDSVLDFDVLLFNKADISNPEFMTDNMPSDRSESQLYIFVASDPVRSISPTSRLHNSFFNLTWTYKFESDIFHPYFVVKNNIGEVIAPKVDVKWINFKYLAPTNKSIVRKLLNKRIAAAWVSAICKQESISNFIGNLVQELSKYGHHVDHYGRCGHLSCPRNPTERIHLLTNCYKKFESDYYFYLAFENYFAEDYVTEKVLHGLQHFLVPIVFGGANYTRFLPYGSYIDALKLGAAKLAKEMYDIINDPPRYYNFFRWHGYYSFQDTTDSDHRETVCDFCAFLNKGIKRENRKEKMHKHYGDISNWLNTSGSENSLEVHTTIATRTNTELLSMSSEQEQNPIDNNNFITNFLYDLFGDDK